MSNVVQLDVLTKLDLPSEQMLKNIAEEKPAKVFVICWPEDGSMPTYHSNTSDIPVILMRLREFEHKYFSGKFS